MKNTATLSRAQLDALLLPILGQALAELARTTTEPEHTIYARKIHAACGVVERQHGQEALFRFEQLLFDLRAGYLTLQIVPAAQAGGVTHAD